MFTLLRLQNQHSQYVPGKYKRVISFLLSTATLTLRLPSRPAVQAQQHVLNTYFRHFLGNSIPYLRSFHCWLPIARWWHRHTSLKLFLAAVDCANHTKSSSQGLFINYVRMILAIFDPPLYPHVRIFQTPPPYSYVRFHFVFQHNKMLLEKDQLH